MLYQWYLKFADKVMSGLPSDRLLSLDVFRGITITAMVLVNNPGSWSYVYEPMSHAKWHGWTSTDLIFPFFVFIIGVSVAIVSSRTSFSQTARTKILKTAFVRGTKLFGLGLFLALFFYNFRDPNYSWWEQQFGSIRVMGVLQRLGIVFFATMCIVVFFKQIGRAVIMLFLLVAYWLTLKFVPYSADEFVGVLEFGNNFTAWVDSVVFASHHLYYNTATPFAFDPEGIFSTFPAIAGCIAGVFTGELLIDKQQSLTIKIKKLVIYGTVCIVIAYLWAIDFPINKSIWTSSFVLLSTGIALVSLALLTYLVDVKRFRYWTAPFVIFGANAIAFYMFSAVVARIIIMIPIADISLKGWLYQAIYQPLFGNYFGSLMFAVTFCILCFFVMQWLYNKRIFFKV